MRFELFLLTLETRAKLRNCMVHEFAGATTLHLALCGQRTPHQLGNLTVVQLELRDEPLISLKLRVRSEFLLLLSNYAVCAVTPVIHRIQGGVRVRTATSKAQVALH